VNEKYDMKKWILFLAIILALCSSIARADDFEDARDAYQKGNYAQAIELFRPLAAQGNARAQYNLGFMYLMADGVIQDYKEAVKWFLLAAEQGYADAQYNLGLMYGNRAIGDNAALSVGLFITPELPTIAPHRFGITAQSSFRFGRIAILRPMIDPIITSTPTAAKSGGHCIRPEMSCT